MPLAIASIALAVVGLLLALLAFPVGGAATDSGFKVLSVLGWLFSGIIALIAIGYYRSADTKRQAESLYFSSPAQTLMLRLSLGFAVIGVLVSAVEIALWVSKTVAA